ncbi:alpha-L-fucosidase [Paenibacillus koleovorans]|uniref:alpha-L-fucosidase n=1 Tax=Paenibacillus koleovorans TaxID=121608 RepID=UPI000FDB3192|nr:alpha-L-fucosidase [Paenibacillus koleovorans]
MRITRGNYVYTQEDYDDFKLDMEVRFMGEPPDFSILFRVGAAGGYELQLNGSEAVLHRNRHERSSLLAAGKVRLLPSRNYTIRLETYENKLRFYVDQLLVLDTEFEDDNSLDTGRIDCRGNGTVERFGLLPLEALAPLPDREARWASWFRDAKIGLFVHWGLRTGEHIIDPFSKEVVFPYKDEVEFEEAAAQAGWSAAKWVETAKQIGAKYITYATFHSRLGYLRTWPSSIPGSMQTKRDYLQELIDAAEEAGIKVILYSTGSGNEWWNEGGIVWLDKAAYQAYTKTDTDITSRIGFMSYACEVIHEAITNYPKLAGFWFDGWGGAGHDPSKEAVSAQLMEEIHRRMPLAVNIRNNFKQRPLAGEDVMALEDYGKTFSPSYDFASGTWIGAGGAEAAFKTIGDWFYLGPQRQEWQYYEEDPSVQELTKRIIAILASSWNANLGYGPKIGGEFPERLNRFSEHFGQYLQWAGESIFGTEGGGYGRGGLQPGNWNDGAYGVTTYNPNTDRHFLHVLTAPSRESSIRLPDGGYTVLEATLLKTGQALVFAQAGGELSIEVPTWEGTGTDGDTIIRLVTAPGGPNYLSRSQKVACILGERGIRSLTDAPQDPWDRAEGEGRIGDELVLSWERPTLVHGLTVLQPEWNAVTAKDGNNKIEQYECIIECGLEQTAAFNGTLLNQRGAQTIRFAPVMADRIRLSIRSTYNQSSFALSAADVVARLPEATYPGGQ